MKSDRRLHDLARAEALVRLGESRVAKQQPLIANLKRRGLSTREAAAALSVLTLSLQEMENHFVHFAGLAALTHT
jgi:hypothetical protein